MVFEETDKETMAPLKEAQFTVRMDNETSDWLTRKAGGMDTTRSDIIRAAVLLAVPQFEQIPGLLNICLEDIKGREK